MPMIISASPTDLVQQASKTITFTGAATLGATGNLPIFTTTGTVLVWFFVPVCLTSLTSASGTIALGVTGNTTLFVPTTTASTITSTNNHWVSATPTAAGVSLPTAMKDTAITANIIGTVATANITAGVMRFDVWYQPLSAGASLT